MLTAAIRQLDFPSLRGKTYLNTAAEGIPPRAVIGALEQYAADKQLGMDGRVRHEEQWHAARREVGNLFGLSEDEIGICSCSSEVFNLAALALQLKPGDEVVINELDFPAGTTPWLQSTCAADVKLWRARSGVLPVNDLIGLLSPRTRLVVTSFVSFYNGWRISLDEVAAAVRRFSPALLAVDVTQALGRISMNLSSADLIVSSTHKWLLASHGGGLVGIPSARAAEWTVPAGGWFNLQNAFEADRFECIVTRPGARSFCVGMPNYPAIYAIAAAAGYLRLVGVPAIEVHADKLVRACLDGLRNLPIELITPDEPGSLAGIVAFRHPKAEEIHRCLREQQIHLMSHAGRLRISLHGYNSHEDVDHFLKALHAVLKQL